jgi:hypothetical protein
MKNITLLVLTVIGVLILRMMWTFVGDWNGLEGFWGLLTLTFE